MVHVVPQFSTDPLRIFTGSSSAPRGRDKRGSQTKDKASYHGRGNYKCCVLLAFPRDDQFLDFDCRLLSSGCSSFPHPVSGIFHRLSRSLPTLLRPITVVGSMSRIFPIRETSPTQLPVSLINVDGMPRFYRHMYQIPSAPFNFHINRPTHSLSYPAGHGSHPSASAGVSE